MSPLTLVPGTSNKGHDTYTNATVESGLVCTCVMHYDWIVGPYPRLIRRVGNHEK